MKTKLLIIGTLLFTLQTFSQGFSGFKIHKEELDKTKNNFYLFERKLDNEPDLIEVLYGTDNNFLNQAGITIGNNSGAIYTEIAGGRFLEYFRLSLGVMVNNTNGDTEEEEKVDEAYQRLVSYGGNTILNIEYPWLYKHFDETKANIISRFFLKGTADIPAMGTTTEDWAGSGSIGVNLYLDATTIEIDKSEPDDNQIKVFFDCNTSYIIGTDLYKENLAIGNSKFLFGQLTAGIVYKSLKVSVIFASFSSEPNLRKNKTIIGVQGIQ